MAAKSLQKPKIIGVAGSSIRVAHPDLSKNIRTYLRSQSDAATTALVLYDNNGFAENDNILFGEVGRSTTEAGTVDAAVTRGSALTASAKKFDHEMDAPVTLINETQVQIYGSATDGGSLTLINTVDIQWDKAFTEYILQTGDTAYAFYSVKFYDGTTESDASDYVASTGASATSIYSLIEKALDNVGAELDQQNITLERCVKWADLCQDAITNYILKNPVTGQQRPINWDFEIKEDITSLTTSTNEAEYSMAGLTNQVKTPLSDQSIVSVRIGTHEPLTDMDEDQWEATRTNVAETDVATEANAGDTTLVLDSNAEFADSGSIYVGDDIVTYTGKSGSQTLTGIPASGAGAITATHAVDAAVWQGLQPGKPTKYVFFNNTLKLNIPVKSTYDSLPIKVKYYAALSPLTEASDETDITFASAVFPLFIASKIEQRRGKNDLAKDYMRQFEDKVESYALNNQELLIDETTYYEFINP